MGTRLKELVVCVLDVSESMEAHLKPLTASLFTFVHSQLVFKPDNEVGLLFFGTSDTDNALQEEMRKRRKKRQYQHVKEIKSLEKPDVSYLNALEGVRVEEGEVDYVDALTVAIDCIKRRAATKDDPSKYLCRILLFSDFSEKCKDAGHKFSSFLEEALDELNIKLEAFIIDVGETNMKRGGDVDVQKILGVRHASIFVRKIRSEIELYSLFPAKPVSGVAMYRGPLEIGDMMTIPVKVFKKTSRERLPNLKLYSSKSSAPTATHEVVRDVEHKRVEDPSEPVPSEFQIRGYEYGNQVVPIPIDIEKQLDYTPVKGMRLYGFVPRHQVPRHHYIKDAFVVVPEIDPASQAALSALVQQCASQEKVGIVQCALRKGSAVFLGVLSPFMDHGNQPDAFLMNVAPFAEDVREFAFGSFSSKESLMPSEEQLQIMHRIVTEAPMEIDSGDQQLHLQTDKTSNPLLQRFHRCLGKRSFQEFKDDPLTNLVFPKDCSARFGKELEQILDTSAHLFKKQKKPSIEDDY